MPNKQLPFYPVFKAFRNYGYTLGIPEYEDLIRLVSAAGIYPADRHVISRDALLEICKLLWLKPGHAPFTFEDIFNEGYRKINWQAAAPEKEAQASPLNENPVPTLPDIPQFNSQSEENDEAEEDSRAESSKVNMEQQQGDFFRILIGEGEKQHVPRGQMEEAERKFLFSNAHYPVSGRSLYQLFRKLPEKRRSLATREIDFSATIDSTARNGYLDAVQYLKETEIINQILVFHDQKGSMVAFEELSALIGTTLRSLFQGPRNRTNQATDLYFRNVIEEHVYNNTANTRHVLLETLLQQFKKGKRVACIIISDAGAARGSNDNVRVNQSIRMLLQLGRISSKIAWLNPMPVARWQNTSAARIANFIPMFEISNYGITQAVEHLRGKQSKALS